MKQLGLKGSLGLYIFTSMHLTSFANVGVPSAAGMVHQADFIALGIVRPTQPPSFETTKFFKGAKLSRLGLVDPSEGQFLTFNLSRVTEIVGASPTIVFGRLDEKKSLLSLMWLNASLWPQGHRYDTFDSGTVEKTQVFLDQLLKYSAIANEDPDGAVRALIADIKDGDTQAALAYLEVAVEVDFDASSAEHIRAVAVVVLKNNSLLDAASVRQLADISHVFLASLFTPLALVLAEDAAVEDSKRLLTALHSMLKARGASVEPSFNVVGMRRAFTEISVKVQRAEARRLISIFESPLPTLRETYSDTVMAALVGRLPHEVLQGLSSAQKKEIWLREIDTISDQKPKP